MNFFKRLFNIISNSELPSESKSVSKLEKEKKKTYKTADKNNSFEKEHQEDTSYKAIIDSTLKIIEDYYASNNIEPIEKPINHPKNLDQIISDISSFVEHCKNHNFAVMILATAFNGFMIKKHNFQHIHDSKSQHPLRFMILKFNKQNIKIELYPIEHIHKIINEKASFNELYERTINDLENISTSINK